MNEAINDNKINNGDYILLASFGAGFTWGSMLIRWDILKMKMAWIFPGQGSQYIGMGKDLYENSELGKKYL